MIFEINPKYASDPKYVQTMLGLRKAAQETQERRAKGELTPALVDNPTPAELADRRFVATCDEANFDSNSSGE